MIKQAIKSCLPPTLWSWARLRVEGLRALHGRWLNWRLYKDNTNRHSWFVVPGYDTKVVTPEYQKLYFPADRKHLVPIVDRLRNAVIDRSDERLCIEIMKYTTSSMALGAPEKMESASKTLKNALSSCGGYSLVFCELARVAGIPARYLGFFGIPGTGSHALAEVFYDNRWHLFDPTFGVFCYSTPDHDGRGHILCAQEIVSSKKILNIMQVVETPWQLNYHEASSYHVQPLLDPPTSHVLTYWNDAGRRIIFPIAFGNDSTISIPISIDLKTQSAYELGQITGEWLDTWLTCIDDPRNGYFFLGGDCPRIYHYVQLELPACSCLKVRYISTEESTGILNVFPLSGCLITKSDTNGKETVFNFNCNSSNPAFLLMSEKPYWIDAVRYSLEGG